MPWATLEAERWISFQDIIDSGIPLKAGQSHYTGSAQWITRSELTARYEVVSRILDILASNQWVPKYYVRSAIAETQFNFNKPLFKIDNKSRSGWSGNTGACSGFSSGANTNAYYDGTISVNQYIYTEALLWPYTESNSTYWIDGKAVTFQNDFVDGNVYTPYFDSLTSLYRYRIQSVHTCGGGGTPSNYTANRYYPGGCSLIESGVIVAGFSLGTGNWYLGNDYNVYNITGSGSGTPVATCSGNAYGSCAAVPIP